MKDVRLFFFENRAVYAIMWKNSVQPDRPPMTIRRMRIARWIPKTTNTQPEYVILTAFPLQQWLHERASLLRYRYNACLVLLWYRKVKVTDAYTFHVIRTILKITNHHFVTQTVLDLGCRISFLGVRENPNFFTRTKRGPVLSLSVHKRHLYVSH
jgi:hypothetical protein